MFKKFKSIFLSLVSLALFFSPLFVHAQEGFFGEAKTATGMIRNIYWFGVGIVGFAAVVVLVIAGIMYMQSYGDPQKITQAKQFIGGALIGLVLLLFSYTILRTVNPALVRLREPFMEAEITLPARMIYGKECKTDADCVRGVCTDIPGHPGGVDKRCTCIGYGGACSEDKQCCGGGCSPSTKKCACITAGNKPTDPTDCCSGEVDKDGKCTKAVPYGSGENCRDNIYGCNVSGGGLHCQRYGEPVQKEPRCESGHCTPQGEDCYVEADNCCNTPTESHCEVKLWYFAETEKIMGIPVFSNGKCEEGSCTKEGDPCDTRYSNCCEGLKCIQKSGEYPKCVK